MALPIVPPSPALSSGILASSAAQRGEPVETGESRPYLPFGLDQYMTDPSLLALGQYIVPGMAAIQWGGGGVQEGPTDEPLPPLDPYTNPGLAAADFLPGRTEYPVTPPPTPSRTELPIQEAGSTKYETPSVEQGPLTMYKLDEGEIYRKLNQIEDQRDEVENDYDFRERMLDRDLESREYNRELFGSPTGIQGAREAKIEASLNSLKRDLEASRSLETLRLDNSQKQLEIQREAAFNEDAPQDYVDEILPETLDIPTKVGMERQITPHHITHINGGGEYRNLGTLKYQNNTGIEDGSAYKEKIFVSVPNDADGFRVDVNPMQSWQSQLGIALPEYNKHWTKDGQSTVPNAFAHSQVTERQFDELDAVPSYHVESIQSDIYPLSGVDNPRETKKEKDLFTYQEDKIRVAYAMDPEGVFPMMKDNRWVQHVVDRNIADAINDGYDVITFNGANTAIHSNQGMPRDVAEKLYGELVPNRLQQIADEYGAKLSTIQVAGRRAASDDIKKDLDILVLDFRGNRQGLDVLKQNGFKYAKGGLVTKNGCSSGLCAADFLPK